MTTKYFIADIDTATPSIRPAVEGESPVYSEYEVAVATAIAHQVRKQEIAEQALQVIRSAAKIHIESVVKSIADPLDPRSRDGGRILGSHPHFGDKNK